MLTMTASGSVSDYRDTSSLRTVIATLAGVDASAVTITVAAASVLIIATIAVPASNTPAAVQALLSAALPTAAAASSRLGVTVEASPTVVVVSPSSLEESFDEIRSDDSKTMDTSVLVIGVVGGGTVLGLVCAIAACALMRRRINKLREENTQQKQAADAKLEAMVQRMTRLNQVVMRSSKAASSAASSMKSKDSKKGARCQVGASDSSTQRLVLAGSASSSRIIRRATSDLVPGLRTSSPSQLSPGASTTDSIGAAAQQAAWVTSQEHESCHEDAAAAFQEAIEKMDLEAIDASIEASQKLQAVEEEKGMTSVIAKVSSMTRAASSSQMTVRKVAAVSGKVNTVDLGDHAGYV